MNEYLSEEELELFKQAQDGDVNAKNKLLIANQRLVFSIANKYYYSAMSLEDIIQEGYIGLVKAIEKYDYNSNNKFSTYASAVIKQNIQRALDEKDSPIKIPVYVQDAIRKIKECELNLMNSLKRKPTLEEIATSLNNEYSVDKIKEYLSYNYNITSLDQEDDENKPVFQIEDDDKVDESTINLHQLLKDEIDKLDDLSKNVIILRYGLFGHNEHSFKEISNILNISEQQARRIDKKARNKLADSQLRAIANI